MVVAKFKVVSQDRRGETWQTQYTLGWVHRSLGQNSVLLSQEIFRIMLCGCVRLAMGLVLKTAVLCKSFDGSDVFQCLPNLQDRKQQSDFAIKFPHHRVSSRFSCYASVITCDLPL